MWSSVSVVSGQVLQQGRGEKCSHWSSEGCKHVDQCDRHFGHDSRARHGARSISLQEEDKADIVVS